jgi:hypothetical protein
MPEYDVAVITVRSGSHTVRVVAEDAATSRDLKRLSAMPANTIARLSGALTTSIAPSCNVRPVVLDHVGLMSEAGIEPS